MSYVEWKQAYEQLSSNPTIAEKDWQTILLEIIHAFNDSYYRNYYCPTSIPPKEEYDFFIKIVDEFIAMSDWSKNDDMVLKAELYRETGRFQQCEDILNAIDYNKYNDLINNFVQTYKLLQVDSLLKVNLYVDVIGSCNDFVDNLDNESITSLEIPLTNKTVAIDITNNLVNNEDNVMICSKSSPIYFVFIVISMIMLIIDIVLIVLLVVYVRNSRTAKTVYEKQLKKILSNYRSYIQKINSKFDLAGYQSLRVDNFNDMLEIHDTTNQPILMVENNKKNSVYFIIPTATKILYVYNIKVSDYEKAKAKE